MRIEDAAGGSGSEITTISTTTDDDAQQFFAVGRDQFNNFVSDVSVTWSVNGGIGTIGGVATSTTLTLTSPGSGSVFADDGSGHTDATGTITVTVGVLNSIVLVDGVSGETPAVGARSMTTDQTLTVHAAGFDADGNYRSDESVTWSVTGGIGAVSPSSGTSTTFDAQTVTTGTIVATHATAGSDATGTITVSVGALSFVRVNSGASGNTSEVTTNTLTTGGTFTVHTSGYDADGNYRSDESVSWSVTGGIGTLSSGSGVSTVLTATTPGTGVVQADHASAIDDATGTITVNAGAIDHILIRTAPDNGGSEIGAASLTADETLTLYAASYDAQDAYLGDVSVTWSLVSGTLAPTPSGTGSSFTFSPTTAPASGVIRATHATAGTDDTGTISVSVGILNFIRVNSGASGDASEVTTQALTADQTLQVHASEYDADGNYRGDLSVNWSVSGGIGSLSAATGVSTTLNANTVGEGIISADDGSGHSDATGAITVTFGALDNIIVVEGESGNGSALGARSITTDQTLTVHAAGFDADGNYRSDESVTWSVTGGIGAVSPSSSTSTTFDAQTTGSGVIRATHATAGTDDSGTITVSVGALSFVRVNTGASGNTAEVTTNTLTTGQTLTVHASGYDADSNYRSDVSVTWGVTGSIGTLSTSSGISTTLTATTPGTGVIQADHATATDDATGTITVQAGAIDHILI
ncbi:hypothetical protein MJD09_19710, partial [bacterium]|nr:hypothetical protein [bacterium]